MRGDIDVRYPDFLAMIAFDGSTDRDGCVNWYGDWRICPTGIFLATAPHGEYLSSEERASLPRHPTGDYSQPILAFPCALGDLLTLLDEHGLGNCIESGTLARRASEQPREPAPDAPTESDAALGRARREQLRSFAERSEDRGNEREPEWERWRAKAAEIQAGRTRKASKRKLAQLVKDALSLPDSPETIRKKL